MPPLRMNWNVGAAQENLQDALHRREVCLRGRHDSVLAAWIVPLRQLPPGMVWPLQLNIPF